MKCTVRNMASISPNSETCVFEVHDFGGRESFIFIDDESRLVLTDESSDEEYEKFNCIIRWEYIQEGMILRVFVSSTETRLLNCSLGFYLYRGTRLVTLSE